MHSRLGDMELPMQCPPDWEYGREKMCRFCGNESYENIEIFSASKAADQPNTDQDDLLHKISTVYPILLYENDPLPQHICADCIDTVGSLYHEIQQVLQHQRNLMNLIKVEHPDHEYFRIVATIKKSTEDVKESVKQTYNIDVPLKILTTSQDDDHVRIKSNSDNSYNELSPTSSNDINKNIRTLEQNGCSIKLLKVAPSDAYSDTDSLAYGLDNDADDEERSCSYCQEVFKSEKRLAKHQLCHMKLTTPKIFEKRLLPKHLRRGRLVTINDEKNIRCLNCWQLFKDNKSILQHWTNSNCHFYCFICFEEYPQAPKSLREHVLAKHEITFRSATKLFVRSHSEEKIIRETSIYDGGEEERAWKMPSLLTPSTKPQVMLSQPALVKKKNSGNNRRELYKYVKSSTKLSDGTFCCNVCHKIFPNYRSSNSHMRVHYMSEIYNCGTKAQYDYSRNDEIMSPSTSPASSNSTHLYKAPIFKPMSAAPEGGFPAISPNGISRGFKSKFHQSINEDLYGAESGGGGGQLHLDWMAPADESDTLNLDDNSLTSSHSQNYTDYNNDYSAVVSPPTKAMKIKSEPSDLGESTTGQWNCFICKEDFTSSKDYEMHAMFVHNIN